ncbi:VQ motif-containing protein 31-like [Telopea speciosissima]|uniref:VQ motif-containing protein 31-like n=1 Tax=Telopea speciosissima TaxID=54955 RepID=UPI001CC70705|nr:VQ motif-containing protein 31-like [Telopea speciosissima]
MAKSANEQGLAPSTTFIQADKTSFRELVQRLTGSTTDCDRQSTTLPPTIEGATVKVTGVKRPKSSLHERRQHTKSRLEIVKPGLSESMDRVFSLSKSGNFAITTSPLGTPSKALLNLSISTEEEEEEEEKAIRERRFYLHPSPRSKPGNVEPELLPLFPTHIS